jgi:hypothetical protein
MDRRLSVPLSVGFSFTWALTHMRGRVEGQLSCDLARSMSQHFSWSKR